MNDYSEELSLLVLEARRLIDALVLSMQFIPTPPGWWHSKESAMSESHALAILRALLRVRHTNPGARFDALRAIGAVRVIRSTI